MRVVPLALAGAWFSLVVPALSDTPDATEILRKAQAAVKAVSAVTYEVTCRTEWPERDRTATQSGIVTLARHPGGFPRLKVRTALPTASDPTAPNLEIISDGGMVCTIDRQAKRFQCEDGPRGAALLMQCAGLLIGEFVVPFAFSQELASKSIQYVGRETVGSEDCYVITVQLTQSNTNVRWWLSAKDYLPRQMERSASTSEGLQKRTVTLKSLDVSPTLGEDYFLVELPGGYELVPPPPGVQPALLPPGAPAPAWSLKTPDGKTVALKNLRGKVVLIDFWATWCLPCKRAMPSVQQLYVKYKEKPVAIYGISTWENQGGRQPGDPAAFMKNNGFTYPLLLNGDQVAQAYNVSGIPTFYVIGHDGRVVYRASGGGKDEALSRAIDRALARMK